MRRFGSVASIVIGVILVLGGVGLGVWALVRGIDKDPAVVAALVTAAGTVVGLAFQRRWEKRRELDRLHRDEMGPLYEQLVETFKQADPSQNEAANVEFFRRWSTKIIVHGPAPVVQAWLAWSRGFVADDAGNLLRWEQVLFAIRADLGHDDSKLKPGDLLRIYINDIDEQLTAPDAPVEQK